MIALSFLLIPMVTQEKKVLVYPQHPRISYLYFLEADSELENDLCPGF